MLRSTIQSREPSIGYKYFVSLGFTAENCRHFHAAIDIVPAPVEDPTLVRGTPYSATSRRNNSRSRAREIAATAAGAQSTNRARCYRDQRRPSASFESFA